MARGCPNQVRSVGRQSWLFPGRGFEKNRVAWRRLGAADPGNPGPRGQQSLHRFPRAAETRHTLPPDLCEQICTQLRSVTLKARLGTASSRSRCPQGPEGSCA